MKLKEKNQDVQKSFSLDHNILISPYIANIYNFAGIFSNLCKFTNFVLSDYKKRAGPTPALLQRLLFSHFALLRSIKEDIALRFIV